MIWNCSEKPWESLDLGFIGSHSRLGKASRWMGKPFERKRAKILKLADELTLLRSLLTSCNKDCNDDHRVTMM